VVLLDVFVEVVSPFLFCFLAFPLLERFFWFKNFNWSEKIVVSFVASLTLVLFPLYFFGVVVGNFFVEASRIIFAAGIVLLIVQVVHGFVRLNYAYQLKVRVKLVLTARMSLLNFALVVSVVFFVAKYTFLLLVKAIIDWDAASIYLPLARLIFTQNLIPLTDQGLNNIGQQGISVLYGFVYSNSSSLVMENFRLMPLVFVLVTFVLVFSIAKFFLNGTVAKLAVIVCCFLPIFDASLSWFSFYPDLAFAALALALFYFLFRYIKTGATVFGVFAGLAFGLSSFMKPISFWLFPVIIFAVLPLLKKRSIRLIVTFLIPFSILLVALPLSFLGGPFSSQTFWTRLASIFSFDRVPYVFSLLLLTFVIAFSVELGVKASVQWPKQNVFKTLLLVLGVSLPFYLIWYLRNYLSFGTFIWAATVNNSGYQWALAIIQKTVPPASSPSGDFYLSNLFVLLALPALGTAFLLPKLVGAVRLVGKNKESSFLYVWAVGYFLMYFLLADFNINERYLLPIAPLIAIFCAAGIFYIVSYLKKSPNVNVMVLVCMFLGLFSVVQSRFLFELGPSYSGVFAGTLFRVVDLLNVPRAVLAGSGLSIASFGSSSLSLFYFGTTISIVMVLIVFAISKGKKSNFKISLQIHKMNFPIKKFFYFVSVFFVALLVLVTPYVSLVYNFSGGDVSAFQNEERLRYGFGNMYSDVLPYLKANANASDVILSVNSYPTELQYYLENTRIIDLYRPENLATMRDIIESNNTSEVFSALKVANVRYVLVPSNVLTVAPYLSGFLDPILTSKYVESSSASLTPGVRAFFKQVILGGWQLYEFQENNLVEGSGAIVTVFQDNVSSVQQLQTFYYDVSNVTSYLRLFGHAQYSLTDVPLYMIFRGVTPSPSSLTLDDQWINFTGSSDVNYTVYWGTLNYQRIGWKDDSFLNGWVPIGAANFSTNGDVVRIMSPVNQSWTGINRAISPPVSLQQFSRFVVEIAEINGSVLFSGVVDGKQQYLGSSSGISSPGTYVFDVSGVGVNLTSILIYLEQDTQVRINYVLFASEPEP
jgi:hypothetical protein